MSLLIALVMAESSCEAREESENYEKFLSWVELDPTVSHLLDFGCNQLHCGADLIVDIYR